MIKFINDINVNSFNNKIVIDKQNNENPIKTLSRRTGKLAVLASLPFYGIAMKKRIRPLNSTYAMTAAGGTLWGLNRKKKILIK